MLWLMLSAAAAVAVAPPTSVVVTATCPDPTDCTAALQAAIDTAGATMVRVPKLPGGQPWTVGNGAGWPARNRSALMLGPASSHRTILFEPGVVLMAKAGDFRTGMFVEAVNATNLTLSGYGAAWQMHKSDYADPSKYNHSEDRHALSLRGCEGFRILGLTLKSSGGDGIYMTGISNKGNDNVKGYCKDVLIQDVVCDDHYRQGMSVISVVKLRVKNSTFSNTNGTAPAAGIDFEPNDRNDRLEDIELTDLTISNNSGNGIDLATNELGDHPLLPPLAMTSIKIKNLLIEGGRGGGIYWDWNGGTGTLEVHGATIRNTMLAGLMLEIVASNTHRTTLRDVSIENVAANFTGAIPADPIKNWHGGWTSITGAASPIVLGDPKYGRLIMETPTGGLSFQNVTVTDGFKRPWAAFLAGPNTTVGAGDVTGTVRVINPALKNSPPVGQCPHALGKEKGEGGVVWIDLDVKCD